MMPIKKELYSPRSRTRIFERWEPEKFRRLRTENTIEIEIEIEDEGEQFPQILDSNREVHARRVGYVG